MTVEQLEQGTALQQDIATLQQAYNLIPEQAPATTPEMLRIMADVSAMLMQVQEQGARDGTVAGFWDAVVALQTAIDTQKDRLTGLFEDLCACPPVNE